jgi:hemoglobin
MESDMPKKPYNQRFDITDTEIEALTRAFYDRVREHEVLGAVFHRAIGEEATVWQEHESKVAAFWRSAVLMDRSYSGSPMMSHLENKEIEIEHFPIWLDLFREVAFSVLDKTKAQNICELSERIGNGLSFGLANARSKSGDAAPTYR